MFNFDLLKYEKKAYIAMVRFILLNATFSNISVIVAVSFIGGGHQRKPPTCRKSLSNFIT
jgi:hypothetical protein